MGLAPRAVFMGNNRVGDTPRKSPVMQKAYRVFLVFVSVRKRKMA